MTELTNQIWYAVFGKDDKVEIIRLNLPSTANYELRQREIERVEKGILDMGYTLLKKGFWNIPSNIVNPFEFSVTVEDVEPLPF